MAKAHWKPGEIVVELAGTKKTRPLGDGSEEPYGPTNTYILIRAFQESFRGRFSVADLAEPASSKGYAAMPIIPGIHIAVDPKRRTIRAVDPLAFPENQAKLRQANKIREQWEGVRGRPWDTSQVKNPTDTDIKSVLCELREIVDDGQGVVVEGRLPEMQDILAMEGGLKRRHHFLRTQQTKDGLLMESPNATEEELARMANPPEERIEKVPVEGTY